GGKPTRRGDKQRGRASAGLGDLPRARVARGDSALIDRLGDEVARAYLDAITAAVPGPATPAGEPPAPGLRVVYTPLHGVAAGLALRAFARAGFPQPLGGAAQAEPDPEFPTVAFPNPEEPGALDLALAQARETAADLVIANDPDGDRLAVAVPDAAAPGGWRALTGDQVGGLLGAYLLDRAPGPEPSARLVATTVVSSTLLSKIAAAAGGRYAETLTGLRGIGRAADGVPGARFVFGYEEALGYAVTPAVRDKDGISAALALLSLAATARAAGQSLQDRWEALEWAHGVHLTAQVSLPTRAPAQVMAAGAGGGLAGDRRRRPRRGGQRAAALGRADLSPGGRAGGDPAERHRAQGQGLPRGGRAGGGRVPDRGPGSRLRFTRRGPGRCQRVPRRGPGRCQRVPRRGPGSRRQPPHPAARGRRRPGGRRRLSD